MVRLRVEQSASHPVVLHNIIFNTHTYSLDTDPDRTKPGHTLITCLELDIISTSRWTMETGMEGQVKGCVVTCVILCALYDDESSWMYFCVHIFMLLYNRSTLWSQTNGKIRTLHLFYSLERQEVHIWSRENLLPTLFYVMMLISKDAMSSICWLQ